MTKKLQEQIKKLEKQIRELKKREKEKAKPGKVSRRRARQVSRVADKPKRVKARIASDNRKRTTPKKKHTIPPLAGKREKKPGVRKSRVVPSTKPKIKRRKKSPLTDYLRDIDYRKPRKRSLLSEFPELDHMDKLEYLLDDEAADEAEETGDSASMWYTKTHAVYTKIEKQVKKIVRKQKRKSKKQLEIEAKLKAEKKRKKHVRWVSSKQRVRTTRK